MLFAGDAAQACDVFGGLAHGQVDIGNGVVFTRVVPSACTATTGSFGAGFCFVELGVLGIGEAVAAALAEPADALDAGGDEHVALAGFDGVEGHASCLQGGGAVAGDGGPRQFVVAEQHGHYASHVETLLAAGQAAAEDEVFDVGGVELGHFGEGGPDDLHGQVVGADAGEGSLEGAADGGSCGSYDNCLGHEVRLLKGSSFTGE